MDLAAKDLYIQQFASKVFSRGDQEPKERPYAHFKTKNNTGPPKKNNSRKKTPKEKFKDGKPATAKPQQKPSASLAAQKNPTKQKEFKSKSTDGVNAQMPKGENVGSQFSTVDVLRKRLHEKIEESRGQGAPKDPSSEAVQAKRAKRKLERERKKRKRMEFRMKKLAEKSGQDGVPEIKEEETPAPTADTKRNESALVFNRVETVEDEYVDKMLKKKVKKQNVKGKITPLTGSNYKQLLSRVEARKAKLEQLREKDEGKARKMEEKIRWTNMLYKAEGVKIKDDEAMLRASLHKKEKRRAQRKKNWEKRSENVLVKMQQKQDKRRKNLQKSKQMKVEKKKARARKKGRILPEDLKKVTL
ncbi:surfeit locus protein 6 [Betta splendens]|uniref:Surfeit locus protein 6 n=1 Tax=Betta splendens TaxID=158456 RepID=A0A6P7NX93_BETSP|nr:surfeit locus protein 6 [Betta splendens]